jgi:hypothetical protein
MGGYYFDPQIIPIVYFRNGKIGLRTNFLDLPIPCLAEGNESHFIRFSGKQVANTSPIKNELKKTLRLIRKMSKWIPRGTDASSNGPDGRLMRISRLIFGRLQISFTRASISFRFHAEGHHALGLHNFAQPNQSQRPAQIVNCNYEYRLLGLRRCLPPRFFMHLLPLILITSYNSKLIKD